MRNEKKTYWITLFLVSLLLVFLLGITTIYGAEPQFGYKALKINGKFVSPEIFSEEQNRFFLRWRTNSTMIKKTEEERIDLLLEDIIDRVVVEEYLFHFANLTITPKELDDYINRYIKTQYSTQEQLEEYMAAMNYKNEADLKKGVELYMRRIKIIPDVARKYGIAIPPAEFEQKYQKHVADSRKAVIRHILISDPDPNKARQQAENIYRQLKNGADFAKMAAQHSHDAGTRLNGGLMPAFAKGRIETEYNEKVFNAKPGELIPPFQTTVGYDIVLVENFMGFHHPKDEYMAMILVEKFGKSDQLKKWMAEIRPKITIEILDPKLKAFRFHKKGRYSQAGVQYEKAFGVYKNEIYLARASESYQSAKDWERLIKLGQFGMGRFPANVNYYLYAAEGFHRVGKEKQALQLMKKAEYVATNSPYYNGLVSQIYSKLGYEADAERVNKKAGLKK